MTNNFWEKLRRIYEILLAVSIVVAGICLIWCSLTIYFSVGEYSRAAVAETFSKVSVPVYICLGLIVLSLALVFIKKTRHAKSPELSREELLAAMYKKRDLSSADEHTKNEISALAKKRKNLKITRLSVCIVCLAVFLAYAVTPSNFDSDINSSVIKAMLVLLPCALIAFSVWLFAAYRLRTVAGEEIKLLRKCQKLESPLPDAPEKKYFSIKTAIIVVAVCFLVYGFASGGTADVLTKAINICTECIGLG